MNNDFDSRHVVITGGTGALGAAVVEALLDRAATCHIPCFDPRELARFPHTGHERIRITHGVDLSDERQVSSFYAALPSLWASIHVAGGFAMLPVVETSLADFRRMIDMNTVTCFLCCREAVRAMRAASSRAGGRIVNVAARPAITPNAGMIAYSASKAAVASMSLCLAEELAPEGIWVNAVVPSIMDTPANRAAMPAADHSRWPSVADVAESICFLASPRNRSTRAALVPVFGRS